MHVKPSTIETPIDINSSFEFECVLFTPSENTEDDGIILERESLISAIEKYKQDKINYKISIGELFTSDVNRSYDVNLTRASHMIEDIWWDGDNVKVRIKLLQTQLGKLLRSVLKEKGVLKFHPRVFKFMDESKKQDAYTIVSLDIGLRK